MRLSSVSTTNTLIFFYSHQKTGRRQAVHPESIVRLMYRLNSITIARLRLLIACWVTPICSAMSASVRSFKKSCSASQNWDFDRPDRACLGEHSNIAETAESCRLLSEELS